MTDNNNVTLKFDVGDEKPKSEQTFAVKIYVHNTRMYGVKLSA